MRMAQRYIEKKRDDNTIIYRIDRKNKRGVYKLNKDSWQKDFLDEVEILGFDALPSGLYRDGKGFTAAGGSLVKRLSAEVDRPLRIRISADEPSDITQFQKSVRVTLNHARLRAVNSKFRAIRQARNKETNEAIDSFLGSEFPDIFESAGGEYSDYSPGTIANLLEIPNLEEQLSDKDRRALQDFIPDFMKAMSFSLKSTNNVRFALDGIESVKTVYLAKVIEEYERRMSSNSSEDSWQKFLRQHILLLLNSYAAVIEKQSIDIDGKYPDFMLVDPYGYLDIYEIKKPQTKLLQHDRGRGNYYWSGEMAKAIAQVEKYIDQTAQQRLAIAEKVRKKHGREIKIVRPRAFIIVGLRGSLENEDMQEDFRVLNDSLKNIDILFYDDLLENIKALLERFTEGAENNE